MSDPGQSIRLGWDQTFLLRPLTHRTPDLQLVPLPGVAGLEGPGRQLDDREGAQSYNDAPGRHRLAHLEYHAAFRHERHVDREAHGKGVDGLARGDDEGAAFRQGVASEQAFPPAFRVERGQQRSRHDAVMAGIRERERRSARSKEGGNERLLIRFRHGRHGRPRADAGASTIAAV